MPVLNAIVKIIYADAKEIADTYDLDTESNYGFMFTMDNVDIIHVWVDNKDIGTPEFYGYVAHECSHAVARIFENLNQYHNEGNDEIYSTTIQHLTEETVKFYEQQKEENEKLKSSTT